MGYVFVIILSKHCNLNNNEAGVGGIEAEAVMLGQAISMMLPKVVGFKLTGEIDQLATSTDVVLTITKVN